MLSVRVTAVITAAVLSCSAAHANKVSEIKVTPKSGFSEAPVLEVYSVDGEKWTDVDQTVITEASVRLRGRCQFEGRGNKAYRGKFLLRGFTSVGGKDPANFLIPHSSDAKELFRWSGEGADFSPVQACNTELQKRRANNPDKSKYEILAKGFTVDYPAAVQASYTLTCKPTGLGFTDSKTRSASINTRVKCKGSPLAESKIPSPEPKPKRAAIKPARLKPLLNAATFEAEPEVHTADCPATVKFNGTLTANRKGKTTYQYVKYDGTKSPVFSLEFTEAGTKPTRAWQTTVSKPNAQTTLSMGGAASSPDDIQGWYRMDVLTPKPGGKIVAHYRVMCGADDLPEVSVMEAKPAVRQMEVKKVPQPARKVKPRN